MNAILSCVQQLSFISPPRLVRVHSCSRCFNIITPSPKPVKSTLLQNDASIYPVLLPSCFKAARRGTTPQQSICHTSIHRCNLATKRDHTPSIRQQQYSIVSCGVYFASPHRNLYHSCRGAPPWNKYGVRSIPHCSAHAQGRVRFCLILAVVHSCSLAQQRAGATSPQEHQ